MGDQDDHAFGSGEPFTLGVEEELFLADPVTGSQINSSDAVLQRVGAAPGRFERELHACQIELISPVCRNVAEAVEALSALRTEALATGAGLIGSGTHPRAAEGEAEITDRDRYERIRDLLGDAVATPVGGLHIHVGMPDPETAIRTFNGLRRHLPLLQALGANSPYRHGRDTGLASAREVSVRGWPRSGAPQAFSGYEDFIARTERLVRAADVADYTWFWWKLRPHPRLGTVEIRALDAQSALEDVSALLALVHCLARDAAKGNAQPEMPQEILEEGIFRAARFGVHARLPDAQGRLRPVAELLAEALSAARRHATELGCQEQLGGLAGVLERGGGAGRQRRVHEIAGMDALLRELLELTSRPAAG